jgi:hypothetical protein
MQHFSPLAIAPHLWFVTLQSKNKWKIPEKQSVSFKSPLFWAVWHNFNCPAAPPRMWSTLLSILLWLFWRQGLKNICPCFLEPRSSWSQPRESHQHLPPTYFLPYLFVCLYIGGTQSWAQGLVLARQAFCHLSQSSSPFCVAVFEMGSHFMPSLAWTTILLFVLPGVDGIIGMYHGTPPLVEMGSCELLPRLTFNHDPPNLCLLSS